MIENALKSPTLIPTPNKIKAKRILEALEGWKASETQIENISTRKCTERLLRIDSALHLDRFKFGLAYLDRFDTSEFQMLSNTEPDLSKSFHDFVGKLGKKIELQGWQGFSGGLDVNEQLTGQYALYRESQGNEAIFHVTPWLPAQHEDSIERKRHFGNDTVVIIFSESLYAFEMATFKSRQTQVIFFVRFINRIRQYQVYVFAKQPICLPKENPFYISEGNNFSELFELLMEAERSCYRNEPLKEKITMMRDYYLREMMQ